MLAACAGTALVCSFSPVDAATVFETSLSSEYLAIITEDGSSDARDFGSGSGSSGEGTVAQSAWGRVHREKADSDSNVVHEDNGYPDPVTAAQELPEVDEPSVSTFGGNIAVLDTKVNVNFSDVDIYAKDGKGVDCVSNCFDAASDSSFFTPDTPDGTDAYGRDFELGDGGTDVSAFDTGIGTSQGSIATSNGVNESLDLSALQTEVDNTFTLLNDLQSDSTLWTHIWTPQNGGDLSNYYPGDMGDYVLSDQLGGALAGTNGTGDVFVDLNIIYIDTGGNDFKFGNSNFILDGFTDQDFVFLLNPGANFLIGNSELLVGPDMDLFSTLWFVGDNSKTTIDFSQSESNGMSFWNDSPEGVIQANNYRACGQWVAENIQDWNNFSADLCAFASSTTPPSDPPSVIPVPATLPLVLSGLLALGGVAARRRATRSA